MSGVIGPGDRVRCIRSGDASQARFPKTAARVGAARVVAGVEYIVAEARAFDHLRSGIIEDRPSFVLSDPSTHWIAWHGRLGGWDADRFRPVDRRWLAELLNVETPVSIDHPERVGAG